MRWLSFVGMAMTAFFVLLWGWQTIAAVTEGRFVYLWFYLPASLGMLAAAAPGVEVIRSRMRTQARLGSCEAGSGATLIGVSRAHSVLVPCYLVLGMVACLAFSIGMLTREYTFPMTGGQELFFPYAVGALGAWFGIYALLLLSGQLENPQIICTPAELRVRRGIETQSIEWDEIENLEAVSLREYQRNSAIRIAVARGTTPTVDRHYRGPFASALKSPPTITVKADQFAVGAVPLYWFLRYYLEHPEDRPELADGRAVDRLLRGALVS